MTIYICDTETTGLTKEDKIIELALLDMRYSFDNEQMLEYPPKALFVQRFKTERKIAAEASAIHGIFTSDLQDSPPVEALPNYFPSEVSYLIGHNISFDIRMLQQCGVNLDGIKPICTMNLAKKYFPKKQCGITSYKLTSLCKHIFPDLEDEIDIIAHSATGDVELVLLLLDHFMEKVNFSWETLHKESGVSKIDSLANAAKEKEKLYTVMPFGKWKGTLLSEVPKDYISWLLKQDLTETLRKSLEEWK